LWWRRAGKAAADRKTEWSEWERDGVQGRQYKSAFENLGVTWGQGLILASDS
jgi:hypothetical protein